MAREDLEYRATLEDGVSPGFAAMAKAAAEADKQLDKVADDAKSFANLERAIQELTKGIKKFGDSSDDVKRTANAVDGVGFSLVKLNSALDLTGKAFAVLREAGDVFLDGVADARELENTIRGVGIVAGDTSKGGLAALKKAAEEASGAFSANEAAQGLGELTRAGLSAENSIKVLTTALNLALGQQIEVADASTLLTKNMTLFKIAAEDSARVADVFSKAADSTETDVTKLGLAMTYAAPLAAELGYSIEETTALLGLMAKNGLEGERAGTALRNVFSGLLDPTSKFSGALRQAGIHTTDFAEIMAALEKRADKGKSVLLALDAEARPAIIGLSRLGSAALADLTTELDNNAGATKRAADAYRETGDTALTELVTAFENARRRLTEPLLEAITDDVQTLTTKIKELVESDSFQVLANRIGAAANEAADHLVKFVDGVDFDAAIEKTENLVTVIGKVAAQTGNLIAVANAVAGGVLYLGTAAGETAGALQLYAEKSGRVEVALALAGHATDLFTDSSAAAARSVAEGIAKNEELQQRLDALANEGLLPAADAAQGFGDQAKLTAADIAALEAVIAVVPKTIKQLEIELRAATKAGDDYNTARLTAELGRAEAKFHATGEAAIGLTQRLQEADVALKTAIEGGNEADITDALGKFKALREEADKNAETYKRLTATQEEGNKKAAAAVAEVGAAHKEVAKEAAQSGEVTEQSSVKAGTAVLQLAARINALRAEFAAFGEGAAAAFEDRLNRINFGFRGLGTSMINYITALENAAGRLRILISTQEDAVKTLETGLSAAAQGLGQFGRTADGAVRQLQQLEASTRDSNGQFNLLSQQRLDRLRSEIQATTQAIQAQAAALRELNQIAAQGDEGRSEELRYQEQLERIQNLADAAGAEGDRAAAEARLSAERQHQRNLAQIAERAAAERSSYDQTDALADRNYRNEQQRRNSGGGLTGGPQNSQAGLGPPPAATQSQLGGAKAGDTINITVQGDVVDKETFINDSLAAIDAGLKRRAQLRG